MRDICPLKTNYDFFFFSSCFLPFKKSGQWTFSQSHFTLEITLSALIQILIKDLDVTVRKGMRTKRSCF